MIVDSLVADPHPVFPTRGLFVFGCARVMSGAISELRNIVYASVRYSGATSLLFYNSKVSANAERRVALGVFDHLQNLSLSFHIRRETGS
jgi:hypothetical protein